MKRWFSDLFTFLIGKTKHPIYRRELAGWSYIRAWRGARRGCIPIVMLLFATTTCLCGGSCGLFTIPDSTLPQDWPVVVISIVIALMVGIAIGELVLRFTTGLLATALTSTVISAEIEAQTFGLLRLTPIPPHEIVLAKFGAAMRQIRAPVAALILVRLLIAVGGSLFLLILMGFGLWESGTGLPGLPAPSAGMLSTVVLSVWYSIVGAFALATVIAWLAYYVLRPMLDILLFAAIGVFASSWARTRATGLISAGAFRLVLWMGSYVTGQFVSTFISVLSIPLFTLPNIPVWVREQAGGPGLLVILFALTAVLVLISIIAVELAITLALLFFAAERAKRLPFLT